MAKPFSNREQEGMFDRLNERMQTFEKDTRDSLSRIELQTTNTSDRVTKLERWQSYVLGFCAAIILVLLPVLFSLLQSGKL